MFQNEEKDFGFRFVGLFLALGLVLVSCDNGTTGDGHTEIENTFYIGCASLGQYKGMYFYIGNTNISPNQNTPFAVFSTPGYKLIEGSDWDNTPDWKSDIEWLLSNYQIKKNGKSVSYTDLPDYSGSGGKDNRKQHFVFALP